MTKIPRHIFREYDIRGVVGEDLSEEFAFGLGQAYGRLLNEESSAPSPLPVAIGWDCRLSSEGYANALAKGIAAIGRGVILTGMGPTPQLYWSLFHGEYAGGIQVTGSHNPADMNGFKICIGRMTISGEAIQKLYQYMVKPIEASPTPGTIEERDVHQAYVDDLIENCRPHLGQRKLTVVVDAGNGVGGVVGPEVLRGLGVEVIELYCEPDGTFPNHHPDPTVMENIRELQQKVIEHKADFGIGWDGDADRIAAIDERGEVIFGDMLMLLYSREVLSLVPGASIVADVKCSSRLFTDIEKNGGNAVMWKTGHSLMKKKLQEVDGALAGEMSGHIFFKHRFYGFDDAIYCAARLVELMSKTDQPLSALLSDVPPMVATPEIRVDCPEEIKFRIPKEAQSAFPEYEVNTVDGARITFPHGWGLVRASNTQPILVLRFEAENEMYLKEYQALVNEKMRKIRAYLAEGDG